MAVPDFQSIMLPLLKVISNKSDYHISEVKDNLANALKYLMKKKMNYYQADVFLDFITSTMGCKIYEGSWAY